MQQHTPSYEEDTARSTWADSAVEFDVDEDPQRKCHEKEYADSSTIATSICVVDPDQERRLVRRIDLHILPLFCVFYFADFLDRSNIGNARYNLCLDISAVEQLTHSILYTSSLAGLQEDLKVMEMQ